MQLHVVMLLHVVVHPQHNMEPATNDDIAEERTTFKVLKLRPEVARKNGQNPFKIMRWACHICFVQ